MYASPKYEYTTSGLAVDDQNVKSQRSLTSESKKIKQQLRAIGASRIAMHSMEGRYLPYVIHSDEVIQGVVFGLANEGFAMLIATDRRAIFLDKKPLFVNEDEITYDVVSGVSYGHAGPGSTITLHTRVKDYTIKTLNDKGAKAFVEAIEARCLEHAAEYN